MKKTILLLMSVLMAVVGWAQGSSALEQLKADPRRAYGTDYPYSYEAQTMTKAPSGYKPFYISHYGRHGSRYYWNVCSTELDSLLTKAHEQAQLTPRARRSTTSSWPPRTS